MKTIRKVMFMGLLLLLALPMAAQRKVKFTIAEKATEQPIIGAVITYADNEKLKSPQRVVTNMDGEATIRCLRVTSVITRWYPWAITL